MFKKRIFTCFQIVVLFFIFNSKLFSQPAILENENVSTIELFGKIIDAKTNEPLPGASLFIVDLKIGTLANASGNFSFKNIPVGHHLIEISHTGYLSIVEHVDLEKNTELNFSLQPSVVENQAIIITGVSSATSIRKTPIAINSIRKTELLQTAALNIIDALSKKSGVSQLTTGASISKPVIRGLGFNRVVVLSDGIRQEGQQWGNEHGIEIDEQSVNRVEILKGPASLMYGSDALAGVIHFITNNIPAQGSIKGNILTNYQTNNNLLNFHSNFNGNKNGFSWNFYQSNKRAKDYRNKFDGRVLNSRMNENNSGGFIGINKNWGFSHLLFSVFNQNLGLVEGERDDNTGKFLLFANTPFEKIATNKDLKSKELQTPFQNVKHFKIASENNFLLKNSKLKISVGYQKNLRKEFGDLPVGEVAGLIFDLQTATYNLQLVLPEKKEWHTTIGINGLYQNNTKRGDESIIPDYNLFDIGGFIYSQKYFKKATVSGGIRFDNRSIATKEFFENNVVKFKKLNNTFSNITASVGISLEPADYFTIKINVARGFRAPNISELSSNGAHEGTNRFEYGNQDLKSETSTQFDAGLQVDYDHLSFGVAVFYNWVNDFIFYNKLKNSNGSDSVIISNGDSYNTFQFNQQDAKLSGLELNIDFHPHPLDWLHFENSISFVEGSFNKKVENTFHLPLIPSARWISELRSNFKKAGKRLHNVYVKVEMDKNFSKQKAFFAFDTESVTDAYALLNAGFGGDINSKKGKILCSIHFSGLNLTNATYQNHLSRLKYLDKNLVTNRTGVFNMGRNFSLKINIPIQFK